MKQHKVQFSDEVEYMEGPMPPTVWMKVGKLRRIKTSSNSDERCHWTPTSISGFGETIEIWHELHNEEAIKIQRWWRRRDTAFGVNTGSAIEVAQSPQPKVKKKRVEFDENVLVREFEPNDDDNVNLLDDAETNPFVQKDTGQDPTRKMNESTLRRYAEAFEIESLDHAFWAQMFWFHQHPQPEMPEHVEFYLWHCREVLERLPTIWKHVQQVDTKKQDEAMNKIGPWFKAALKGYLLSKSSVPLCEP